MILIGGRVGPDAGSAWTFESPTEGVSKRLAMKQKLCPCGEPATRTKYCSTRHMNYYAKKAWVERNKERHADYMRVYHKAWRDRNKDRIKKYAAKRTPEYARQQYLRHRVKHRQRAKEYYQENCERIKAKALEYHHANKEKIKKRSAIYREKNRERLATKEHQRYHQKRDYMTEWRKKNAEVLKARRYEYYWSNREKYLADQRDRNRNMDPEKRKARSRKYAWLQKRKKLEMEFSLLSVIVSQTASKK